MSLGDQSEDICAMLGQTFLGISKLKLRHDMSCVIQLLFSGLLLHHLVDLATVPYIAGKLAI